MEKDEDNKLKTTEAKQALDNCGVSRRVAEEMPNGGGKGVWLRAHSASREWINRKAERGLIIRRGCS